MEGLKGKHPILTRVQKLIKRLYVKSLILINILGKNTKIISTFRKTLGMSALKKASSSPTKTEELIIYIASKLQNKPNYGAVVLNKTLYLVDSMNYLKTGKPISELDYIKQDQGTTPNPSVFLPIRAKLEGSGELQKTTKDYYGRNQIRYIAMREPVIDIFEKEELVIINDVIESIIAEKNATEMSDYNHTFLSWLFANSKEKLPFYTFLLTQREPELNDYNWAKEKIKHYSKKSA